MSRQWAVIGIVVAGLALGAAALTWVAPDSGVRISHRAPEFHAVDLATRDSVSLADYRGSVTLVNIWATWCLPCKEEIPYLEQLHGKHAGQGLQIIGVSIDARGDESKIDEFAREFGMTYPIWRDPEERVNARFLAIGVPSTYLIDRDGILRWKHLGTLRASSPGFAEALDAVLKERGTPD